MFIKPLFKKIKSILAYIVSMIYDYAVSYQITCSVYKFFAEVIFQKDFPQYQKTKKTQKTEAKSTTKSTSKASKGLEESDTTASADDQQPQKFLSMIDIGTGTGSPLYSVLDKVNFDRILAIDINKGYLEIAKKRFKNRPEVEVKYQDYLTYLEEGNTEKFDVIFFGFSFMLLPDKVKALEISRRILKPGGKIYTFLTLYHKKSMVVDYIKPKLQYLTSIDFGKTMYYDQVS